MTFDFELSVSGLCLLTFKGDKKKPDEVNVLLVKTLPMPQKEAPASQSRPPGNGQQHGNGNGHDPHEDGHRHFPLLTYSAVDLTARSSKKQKLVPAADGQQNGQRNLEGKGQIELMALGVKPGIEAVWHPDANPSNAPASAAEESYLDWIPALRRVEPGVPAPSLDVPFAGLNSPEVTAWIRITQGRLEASQVARGISGQYVIWDFKTTDGVFDRNVSQALAGKVVLRLENLDQPVRILGLDGAGNFIELAPPSSALNQPGRPLVQASITNLPDGEVFPSPKRLGHFGQYFSLIPGGPPPMLRLPESSSNLDTTIGSFCPPGSHT